MKKQHALVLIISLFLSCGAHALQIDWLLQQLTSRFPVSEKVEYKSPSGTAMQGKLEHLIYDGRDLGELSWTLDAKALVSGKIAMDFKLGKGSPYKIDAKGHIETGLDKVIYVKNVRAVMPAASVIDLARRPRFYDPQGNLTLIIDSGSVLQGAPYCKTLDATASWPKAKVSSFTGSLDAGDINAQLGCTNNSLIIQTNQSSHHLMSAFKILINPNHEYQVMGWLTPQPRLPAKMRKRVLSLGNVNAQGKISISKVGNL